MSLGVFRFRLAVTTKQRRAVEPVIEDRFFDFLCTEANEPLLTEDNRHIALEQLLPRFLLDEANNIILTEDGDAIDILV